MKITIVKNPKYLMDNNGIVNYECEEHGGNCCAAGYCCNKPANGTP